MGAITTVIFDIGGVLATYSKQGYFLRRGYTEEEAGPLVKATMDNPFWAEYDRGVFTTEEVTELLCRCTPELSDDIRKSLSDGKDIVVRRDRAIPWIRSLKKRGIRVLYLSNFSKVAYENDEGALDFIPETDGGILSYQEHLIKPEPAIYELLISRFHLVPQESVFIDDTFYNLPMAEHFGLHTILYKTQEQAEEELNHLLNGG